MAVKRGKKQARRKDEPSIPGWTWLLVGVLAGAAIAVGVYVKMPNAVNTLLPHPNPVAQPQTASASNNAPEGNPPAAASPAAPSSAKASSATTKQAAATPTQKKPKFDFYVLLPEKEVIIPDEQLSAQVKAEAAANLASKQQAALAPLASSTTTDAAAAAPKTPGPIASVASAAPASPAWDHPATSPAATASVSTSPKAASPVATSVTTTAATAAPTTAAVVNPATEKPAAALPEQSGQYLLQAGAFRKTEQADDLKARIAMLGLVGHVETVQTPAGEMHRVRLGPYATASELAQAKQKLSGGGLPAVAIRVK